MEPGWITAAQTNFLAEYCRRAVAADEASRLIVEVQAQRDEMPIADYVKVLDRALLMRDRETKAMHGMLTAMRLTNQSIRSDRTSPLNDTSPKVWDDV